MRPARILVAAALLVFPIVAVAQVSDTLQLGERVRVRVAPTPGNTNLFIGLVSAVSPDTLVVSIARGNGSVTLPRSSVREVAKSDGHESRWRRAPMIAPMVLSSALGVALLAHHRTYPVRGTTVLAVGGTVALTIHAIVRTPPERWQPVESWLYR